MPFSLAEEQTFFRIKKRRKNLSDHKTKWHGFPYLLSRIYRATFMATAMAKVFYLNLRVGSMYNESLRH